MLVLAIVCWQSIARHFALPTFHAAQFLPQSFWERADMRRNLSLIAAHAAAARVSSNEPRVYPYSVVPGGIRSVNELREVAARDYVVRRHFGGFDFSQARLLRIRERRMVYLSYRIRDRIFWTHKKVLLRAGELLLTDGKIAARARCGNQVSEAAQADVSPDEPSEDVLDRTVAELTPIDRALPFQSPIARPNLPGAEPKGPSPPRMFAGGFYFPYVPLDSAVSFCDDKHHGVIEGNDKKCRPKPRHPAVPEPGSLLLLSSGLVAVYWQYRKGRRPVSV